MRRIRRATVIVLLFLAATASAQGKRALESEVTVPQGVPASRPVAFVDVTVLPMTFNGVLEHQTVVTMHGKIHTVGMVDEPYDPSAFFVNGDTLFLEVSFSGGCADHVFTPCWDGAFMESFPVQVDIDMVHDGHNDPCDAWLTEPLALDLGLIRLGYLTSYGTTGDVLVNLDAESALYSF